MTKPTRQGRRCWWAAEDDPLYVAYHDDEWGFPVADDARLFEKMCLEGFQSGLSWRTILGKREGFRAAFAGFDIERVARYTARDVDRLVGDASIVRHRGKIESTINNAKRAREVIEEFGSLGAFVWRYEPEPKSRPKRLTRETLSKMTTSEAATALSKDLKKRGFTFVGPTTMYAFMQAMGLVNDHLHDCPTHDAVARARAGFAPPRSSPTSR
jgi:DNA-3-methyladenine glycosylase I